MTMPAAGVSGQARPPGWPVLPAALPFLYLWLAWSWWAEVRAQLAAIADTTVPGDPGALAAAAVAGRALAVLSEAGVYALWWRSRGRRLPFWRFACWVAALSATDLLGFALARAAADATEPLRVAALALAGPEPLPAAGAPRTGAGAAFGNLGLLTLARIGLTAWAQARGVGRPLAGPLVLTAVAWLLTRLVAWWSADLLRGMGGTP